MGSFKDGVDKTMPYIMLISVLLMNILLVTGIMKLFFGAVIGGAITWLGVKKNVQENRIKDDLEAIKNNLKYINELTGKLHELFNGLYLEDLTRGQKLVEFKKLRHNISSLKNSYEVFILGDKINKAIDTLGSLATKYELIVMVDIEFDIEEAFTEIKYQIASCFGVIERKTEELRQVYNELKAP